MKVTIHGPNLRDQSKGQFHVHSAGCGDNKHYGPRGKFGGEDNGFTLEAATELDACEFIYCDHLSDYGLEPDDAESRKLLGDWLSDFWFAPCVKLERGA